MKATIKISSLNAVLFAVFSFSSAAQTIPLIQAESVNVQVMVDTVKSDLAEMFTTNQLMTIDAKQTAQQQLVKQQNTYSTTRMKIAKRVRRLAE